MNDPRQPRDKQAIAATVESVVTAVVVVMMIGSVIALLGILTSAMAKPRVGDMVVFKPGASISDNEIVSATLESRPGGAAARSCDLNPAIMAQSGGSIVVEKRSVAGDRYLVHWAGSRTATGSQDCGGSAELSLSFSALQSLVNSVGGRSIVGVSNVF